MKDDIEATRMTNAFAEIILTIQPMLAKCMNTLGDECTVVVVRQLAIEFSARYLLAVKVTVKDANKEELVEDLMDSTFIRLGDLMEDAVGLGLLRRKQ
jgi:CobQ-like glutamine amidotransferase family enzyme